MIDGNDWLIVCAIVYLIWWTVAFNPLRQFPMALKVALFLVTLAFGVTGVIVLVGAIAATPAEAAPFPLWAIALIAIGVYGALLVITSRLLKRQVTTELALIIGWLGLECAAVECLAGAGALSFGATIAAYLIMIIAAAAGMGCYLAYYKLRPLPAFYVGMAPLGLFAAAMIAVNCLATF